MVQVTVLEVVAVLPQASRAVNVLVCEAEHDVMDTVPSFEVIVAALQLSVAVAEPRAALISEAEGLQPSAGITPVIIIAGGLGVFVHVTVVEAVAVLPQASIATKVLVCEAEQEVVDIVPSLAVTDAVPQPSVAVAVPRAAAISEAEGLQPRVVTAPVIVMTGGF